MILIIGSYNFINKLAHRPKGIEGNGISVFEYKNNNIKLIKNINQINPAVLIKKNNLLYSITECIDTNGYINVYDKKYNLVNKINCNGKSSCYLDLKDNYLVAVNYWDGIIDLYKILNNKYKLIDTKNNNHGNYVQVKTREEHLKNRQSNSHAHCCKFWKEWLFVSDQVIMVYLNIESKMIN